MSSPETQFALKETALDRDAFIHRKEIFAIACSVALEERSETPAQESPRAYMYVVIDLAAEAGYRIDHLEAIELLERARDKIYKDSVIRYNFENGIANSWDDDPDIQHEDLINFDEPSAEVNTGENNE